MGMTRHAWNTINRQTFLEFAHTHVHVGRTSEANVPKSKECNTDMTAHPYRNITTETGHTVRQTGTPAVDSHMVSDKSPMACLRVQMAPPICLFNTKGMWRTKCASSPALRSLLFPPQPFKRHFGCIPDVRDVIHQTVPSRRQLHRHGRDVCLIFLDVPSLSQVSAIILQYRRRVLRLETFVFCLKCISFFVLHYYGLTFAEISLAEHLSGLFSVGLGG